MLITGRSGFLGINVVRYLLQKCYHDIVVLDIADFDYPDVASLITFVKGDIRDRKKLFDAIKGVDIVIHTAAAL